MTRYFNYKNYLRYIFKKVEKRMIGKSYHIIDPQFFITGLPRTGTTLVYQYIAHRLHIAYFTNKVGGYYESPCTVTRLSRFLFPAYRSDFKSRYGKVEGVMAPREAGAFWLRFFDIHDYCDFETIAKDKEKLDTLRNTIYCIQDIFKDEACMGQGGRPPFVNKNVKHILRIDALKHIFPASIFIIVERDVTDAALSILEGRKENLVDIGEWWSARPPSYEKLKNLGYVDQVANQVYELNRKLNEDLERISQERVIRVDYRSFCENPEGIIDKMREICPSLKYKNEKVDSFGYRERTIKTSEEEELAEKVRRLFQG